MPTNPNDEVKEMNDVFDDIISKTDEEIQKEADEAAKKSDEPGEANEDLTPEADPKPAEEDPKPNEADPTPDTSTEVDVLKDMVKDLEDQLKKEHQRTSSWDGRIKAANSRVKELETENQSLKDQLANKPAVLNEDEQSEAEIMESFKATFPEFTEVLDIMQKKIDAKATPTTTPAKVDPEPDSIDDDEDSPEAQRARVAEAQKKHMDEIRKVHPAIDEMVKTGVVLTWINEQPDFISSHLERIYYSGSSDEIIKMVTEFSTKTGWVSNLNKGKAKQDKLNSMLETEGGSTGPKSDGPDKNDFAAGAKDAGL